MKHAFVIIDSSGDYDEKSWRTVCLTETELDAEILVSQLNDENKRKVEIYDRKNAAYLADETGTVECPSFHKSRRDPLMDRESCYSFEKLKFRRAKIKV